MPDRVGACPLTGYGHLLNEFQVVFGDLADAESIEKRVLGGARAVKTCR